MIDQTKGDVGDHYQVDLIEKLKVIIQKIDKNIASMD